MNYSCNLLQGRQRHSKIIIIMASCHRTHRQTERQIDRQNPSENIVCHSMQR